MTRAPTRNGYFALALVGAACGCGGTTGNDHVQFPAAAAGPADATGGSITFANAVGWQVTLERARLHVAGLYLNQTVPLSGRQAAGCWLPGVYVAQAFGPVDVDLLSPTPVPFPTTADGLAVSAHVAEVWLGGGVIDAADDSTVVLDVAGTADKSGATIPFAAALTIGANRLVPVADPTLPNAHPICLERIVTPIEVDLLPVAGHTLLLRADPRRLFLTVDFGELPASPTGQSVYQFADAPTNNADLSLYRALHATSGVYDLVIP